jgi:hypothetical protein
MSGPWGRVVSVHEQTDKKAKLTVTHEDSEQKECKKFWIRSIIEENDIVIWTDQAKTSDPIIIEVLYHAPKWFPKELRAAVRQEPRLWHCAVQSFETAKEYASENRWLWRDEWHEILANHDLRRRIAMATTVDSKRKRSITESVAHEHLTAYVKSFDINWSIDAVTLESLKRDYKYQVGSQDPDPDMIRELRNSPLLLLQWRDIGWKSLCKYLQRLHLPVREKQAYEVYGVIDMLSRNQGHSCTPDLTLESEITGVTGSKMSRSLIRQHLKYFLKKKVLCQDQGQVFQTEIWKEEEAVASFLSTWRPSSHFPLEPRSVVPSHFNERKEQALQMFRMARFGILTGLAGTGKTTVISWAVAEAIDQKSKVCVLAPTGKAVSVLKRRLKSDKIDLDSVKIATIHSFAFLPGKGNFDLCIVDEMSMVDLPTFARLVRVLSDSCRLIMCGDENQLPSVQYGQVFADIIASRQFPRVALEQIMRSGDILAENNIKFLDPTAHLTEAECFQYHTLPKPEDFVAFLDRLIPNWCTQMSDLLVITKTRDDCKVYSAPVREAYLRQFDQKPDGDKIMMHDRVICKENGMYEIYYERRPVKRRRRPSKYGAYVEEDLDDKTEPCDKEEPIAPCLGSKRRFVSSVPGKSKYEPDEVDKTYVANGSTGVVIELDENE